ncbi:MAG: carboxylate-amine ligase [Gammaproteobacteria bacterium]|jgi:carboxylate-amine ligase|nr:carboxylate-amine ligase [Gammaproteobacteria bacterium]|tara:strand:- start:347 stop:1483 length:1137 start_codon:yes stop_codon:yes gene_type:complete
MTLDTPQFTLGIEEEYLLVDKETRSLVINPPKSLLKDCKKLLGNQVTNELLLSQIEVGTKVCHNIQEAHDDLVKLRKNIVEVTARHGLAPIACSTHPFSRWSEQEQTPKDRYELLTREMQAVARRMLICGMHVHVGIDDNDLRIDLMSQLSYFLPHLLSLSCSSPFWNGEDTGLKSYRLTIFDNLPRTGIPSDFHSYSEYEEHIEILTNAGVMEDSTKIWWDIRPSAKYPTLETRIMDVCTRTDDAISLTALVVSTLRALYRLRMKNQRWREYSSMLIRENRWRAMRYSYDEGLIDFGKGSIVPFEELLDEFIEISLEDAKILGCEKEVMAAKNILNRGTSAHRQLDTYKLSINAGKNKEEALKDVVDMLIKETAADL